MASNEKELKDQLLEVGSRLSSPPLNVEELKNLLDETRGILSRVEQQPQESLSNALQPTMAALVARGLLDYSDMDVKVSVTSCISEITRITAPNAPYHEVLMKEIFERIIEAFEHLDDVTSRSFPKRVAILQTVAKVRSSVVMLDLECDHLILKMFQLFLDTVRPNNADQVFPCMEVIMTLVLEESEEISSDLIRCLMESVKVDNDNLPIAHRLGEKVIIKCAQKLKPYLRKFLTKMSLRDYSSVIVSSCRDIAELDSENRSKESELTISDDPIQEVEQEQGAEEVVPEKLAEPSVKTMVDGNSVEEPSSLMQKSEHLDDAAAVGENNSVCLEHVHEDPDGVTDPIPKKDPNESNDSEQKPLILDDKRDEPNGLAKAVESPGKATSPSEKPQKQLSKKVLEEMNSRIKANKTKGKQSITKRGQATRPLPKGLDGTFVGSRIKVWWPEDKQYYPGTVANYNTFSKKHKIIYDDGDVEILLMKNERWEFLNEKGQAEDDSDPDNFFVEPQSKRAKISSGSVSKESKRDLERSVLRGSSAPPKRRGRPPKALSLGGGGRNDSGKAIWKSDTKKDVDAGDNGNQMNDEVEDKPSGSKTKADSGCKERKLVLKSKIEKGNAPSFSESDMIGLV